MKLQNLDGEDKVASVAIIAKDELDSEEDSLF